MRFALLFCGTFCGAPYGKKIKIAIMMQTLWVKCDTLVQFRVHAN